MKRNTRASKNSVHQSATSSVNNKNNKDKAKKVVYEKQDTKQNIHHLIKNCVVRIKALSVARDIARNNGSNSNNNVVKGDKAPAATSSGVTVLHPKRKENSFGYRNKSAGASNVRLKSLKVRIKRLAPSEIEAACSGPASSALLSPSKEQSELPITTTRRLRSATALQHNKNGKSQDKSKSTLRQTRCKTTTTTNDKILQQQKPREKSVSLPTVAEEESPVASAQNSLNKSTNLAHRIDVIEELLLDNDKDNNHTQDDQSGDGPSPPANAKKKLSISPRSPSTSKNPERKEEPKNHRIRLVTQERGRRFKGKCSPPVVEKCTRSVYDFLSQSQNSDTDNDPAADVVKKLIDAGKVTVATKVKGKGIVKIKRQRKKPGGGEKVSKKPLQEKLEIEHHTGNEVDIKPPETEAPQETQLPKDGLDFEDVLGGADEISNIDLEPLSNNAVENSRATASTFNRPHIEDSITSDNAAFSRLARSVLINEAEKSAYKPGQIKDPRKLLEMARKLVSTPVNKKNIPPRDNNLSPIVVPSTAAASDNDFTLPRAVNEQENPKLPDPAASPWRVTDERSLPKVFYFSHDSANLPSFSSDFIPPSPKKHTEVEMGALESPKVTATTSPRDKESVTMSAIPRTARPNYSSSFNSNDSNAENVPPPGQQQRYQNRGNGLLTYSRQTPNSKQHMRKRSPLKDINILDIVSLPTLPNFPMRNDKDKRSNALEDKEKSTVDKSKRNLFGFEEFLGEANELGNETDGRGGDCGKAVAGNKNYSPHNNTLHEKLQRLKKFRPSQQKQHMKQPLQKQLTSTPIVATAAPRVFDDDDFVGRGGAKGGQRNIKDMLCSTMINAPKQRNSDLPNIGDVLYSDDSDDDASKKRHIEEDLFSDVETTLNEKNTYRTYARPARRKRKVRYNFESFMDSDVSESEGESHAYEDEDGGPKPKKKAQQHKKTRKEDPKLDEELDSFVSEFNEMCKEVNQYDLIVEKSTQVEDESACEII